MEQELKYALTNTGDAGIILKDEELQALKIKGTAYCKNMEADYYDFSDMRLNKAGVTFRVRKENEQIVATLKKKSSYCNGLFQREEWNEQLDTPEADFGVFQSADAVMVIQEALNHADMADSSKKLQCVVSTRFERKAFQIRYKSMIADVSVDVGNVFAEEKSVPICELEMELIEGNIDDLIEYGEIFSKKHNLKCEKKSKFARGLGLKKASKETKVSK